MLNERNTLLEDDGIEEEILVEEECSVAQAMWGDIGGNIENQTDLQNALDAKQDSLTEAQLNAVNSGITSEKVTTYDGYADQIASKADQSALNAESTARGEADTALGTRIDNEALARQQADNGLQSQIDAITSKSDVVDVVANYAALQAYDTSTLGNNDVVKVLDDETHEDALTYYRWSTTTQTWSYIGQEAPYYSKGQMDTKLAEKQDKLTAGANIQIQNGTISATDTTYTAGNGINLNGTEFSADTTVLATKSDLDSYYTKPETDTKLAPKLEAEVVAELPTTGTESKLYLTPKAHTTSTATGNPIEATVTEQAGQLESFQLDGDTFQQTYTGKNLFVPPESTTSRGVTYIRNNDGSFNISGTATGGESLASIFTDINLQDGDSLTLSSNVAISTGVIYRVEAYNGNSWLVSLISQVTTMPKTISIPSNATRLRYSIGVLENRTVELNNVTFQLEKGTATSYEPYVGGQPSPNPDYPQTIQTVTGEQVVEVQGKNLLKLNDGTMTLGGVPITTTNGTVNLSGTATSGEQGYYVSINITASEPMVFSTNKSGTTSGLVIKLQYKRGGTVYYPSVGSSLSLQAGDIIQQMYLIVANGSTLDGSFSPMLEKGSTKTSFEPYSKQTYPLDLGSIELCEISEGYSDYIWKDGEEWKVHKATASITFNGSESDWHSIQMMHNYRYYLNISNIVSPQSSAGEVTALCSHFSKTTPGNQWSSPDGSQSFIVNNSANPNSSIGFTVGDSTDKLDGFKAWLAENTPTALYALYTPTDTTITDTALIAQLEAIRTASLENGTNTITNTATGTNLAGDMEIGYYGFNPTNRYDKFIWLDLNNNYEQIGS